MPGSATLDSSLVDDLYTDVVDGLREDLLPAMGIRPYRVYLVTRTWSGGEVGLGTPSDVATEFRPIPRVHQWNDRFVQKVCGVLEDGDIVISELSLTYTHSEIGASEPPMGAQWMIRVDEGHGQQNPSRYFVHKKAPFIDREDSMGWVCQLARVQV